MHLVQFSLVVLDLIPLVIDLLLEFGTFLENVLSYGETLLEVLSLWKGIGTFSAFLKLGAVYDNWRFIYILKSLIRILFRLYCWQLALLLLVSNVSYDILVVVIMDSDIALSTLPFENAFTKHLSFLTSQATQKLDVLICFQEFSG